MKETLKDFIEEIYEGVIVISEIISLIPSILWDCLQSFFTILCKLAIFVTIPLWILPYTIYKNHFDNKDTGKAEE